MEILMKDQDKCLLVLSSELKKKCCFPEEDEENFLRMMERHLQFDNGNEYESHNKNKFHIFP